MKLWERMIEARLIEITKIADNQFGFRPGKSTAQPIFCIENATGEIQREKQRAPHGFRRPRERVRSILILIPDRVPRELNNYGGAYERKGF